MGGKSRGQRSRGHFCLFPPQTWKAALGWVCCWTGLVGGGGCFPSLPPAPILPVGRGSLALGAFLLQMKPQEDGGWESGKTLPELHLQTLSPRAPTCALIYTILPLRSQNPQEACLSARGGWAGAGRGARGVRQGAIGPGREGRGPALGVDPWVRRPCPWP